MSEPNLPSAPGHHNVGHEMTDLNFKPLVWVIPASIAFIMLFVTVVILFSQGVASSEMTSKQYGGAEAYKGQLQALHAHEDSILLSTGEDSSGDNHIPIEKAIEILADKKE